MAVIYLRSTDGNDADDGSTWALAKATLAAALTAAGAGGTVYVSQAHSELQASGMTLTSPGTPGSLTNVLCVNDSAEPPTSLAISAVVATTASNSIAYAGFAYSYGVTFVGGNSTGSGSNNFTSLSPWGWIIERGALQCGGTSASGRLNIGVNTSNSDDDYLKLINSSMQFTNVGQGINCAARFEWSGSLSSVTGATTPTNLFLGLGIIPAQAEISGVDLSALGSGKNLVQVTGAAPSKFAFRNCKLGSSVSVSSGTIVSQGGAQVFLDNCDSGDTNYRMEHYKYQGSIKSETSKIRSGGASDGTTPLSWNMTSLAGASFASPLESPQFVIWNDTTGSAKTVTVEIAQDSAATALTDGECWLEVEYLGTSGYPISSTATDRKSNILASAANQTTSSATWNNMTTPTKQKLEVTFTPQEKGFFQCRVMLAKPSVTVYVDPMATVS